jgi:hypothetical protein
VHLSHNSKAVADMRQPPRYLRVHRSEEAKKGPSAGSNRELGLAAEQVKIPLLRRGDERAPGSGRILQNGTTGIYRVSNANSSDQWCDFHALTIPDAASGLSPSGSLESIPAKGHSPLFSLNDAMPELESRLPRDNIGSPRRWH